MSDRYILIVDPDESFRERLSHLLPSKGVRLVFVEEDDRETLTLLHRHRPKIVFISVELPDKVGFSVFTKVKKAQRNLPVVLTTSTVEKAETSRALSMANCRIGTIRIRRFRRSRKSSRTCTEASMGGKGRIRSTSSVQNSALRARSSPGETVGAEPWSRVPECSRDSVGLDAECWMLRSFSNSSSAISISSFAESR